LRAEAMLRATLQSIASASRQTIVQCSPTIQYSTQAAGCHPSQLSSQSMLLAAMQ
jgi:hypothetical protein